MRFNMWLKLCLCGLGNIVDHVSVHAKAAYLLIQSYYVLACLSTSNYCIMFVAHFWFILFINSYHAVAFCCE